jgi:hypothetical protein
MRCKSKEEVELHTFLISARDRSASSFVLQSLHPWGMRPWYKFDKSLTRSRAGLNMAIKRKTHKSNTAHPSTS